MTTTAALHDLAYVLDAHMEEGQITPAGREMVSVALGRVFPDRVHTVERCDAQECRELGCEECPCDTDWRAADARLSVWLRDNPRTMPPTPTDQIQAAREAPVKIDGIPVLVRGTSGWSVVAEDGTRFNLVPAGRTALAREENDRG